MGLESLTCMDWESVFIMDMKFVVVRNNGMFVAFNFVGIILQRLFTSFYLLHEHLPEVK